MKKSLLLVAFMAIVGVATAVAQPRAIGGRLTEGVEFSYQHGLGAKNMLSIDAGFVSNRVKYHYSENGVTYREWAWGYGLEGVVTYDWINPFGADFSKVWDHKGEWNWYMGVGGGLNFAFSPYHWGNYSHVTTQMAIGVAGRIGVEYNFWFPLQLSVDWRPVIGPSLTFMDHGVNANFYDSGLYAGAIALSVRYKF